MGPEFLIDTNIVIGFVNGTLPPAGRSFMAEIEPAISVITQIELFSSSTISAGELTHIQHLISVATIYDELNSQIVRSVIRFRLHRKTKTPDAIIAATAFVNGLTLLTRNTNGFNQLPGLTVINPFEL